MKIVKLQTLLLAILTTLVFFSCQKPKLITTENFKKEFYSDGSLKSVFEISNGLKNGKGVEYYSNGIIQSISNWINDTIDGVEILFYESGVVESSISWFKGQLHGNLVQYETDGNLKNISYYFFNKVWGHEIRVNKGTINQVYHYINVDNSPYLNQIINYDEWGNIISNNSLYFLIDYPNISDTVRLNHPIEIIFKLSPIVEINKIPQIQIYSGIFDDPYIILNESSFDSVVIDHHWAALSFLFNKSGDQFVKGYLSLNYIEDDSCRYEKMYFIKHFYVKE